MVILRSDTREVVCEVEDGFDSVLEAFAWVEDWLTAELGEAT